MRETRRVKIEAHPVLLCPRGIRQDGGYAQLDRLYFGRLVDEKRTKEDPRRNPRQRKIGRTELLADYRCEGTVTAQRRLDQERTGHEPPATPSPSPAVSPIDITGRVRRVEPGGL